MQNDIILKAKRSDEPVLISLLKSRGIENYDEFLNPELLPFSSPSVFSDMLKAVEIINNAITNKEKILVWGDFDADGVTSTAILHKTLTALSADFMYFIPDRDKLGHGINSKELLKIKSKNNIKVLITVDCGISNANEINLIKSMGTKVIITDHHEPPEILPKADCILNPVCLNSLSETLNCKEIEKVSVLSGAGVAFILARALLNNKYPNIEKEITGLSAIGTIADVVPLTGENRIIAARGLKELSQGVNLGVKKLFENQNIKRNITSEDIGFILAPRINAAGRLDSPYEALKLLIENNDVALDLTIEKLNSLNKVRQNLCDVIYNEAISLIKNPKNSIVLYHEGWHLGIIGIVASRLVDKFNLPVFMITSDDRGMYRCSIRGTKCHDIAEILQSIKECFVGFGGHGFAGGFSADPNNIEINTLIKKIQEAVINNKDESKENNSKEADIELKGDDIDFDFIDDIYKMEPFGEGNPKPVFLFKDAKLLSEREIGKEGGHLSYKILKDNHEFDCLYWKRKITGKKINETFDFVFYPEISEFNGEKKIKLITSFFLDDKILNSTNSGVKIFDHRQKTGILDKIEEYVQTKKNDIQIFAKTIGTKKLLSKYANITENIMKQPNKSYAVMFFDYPTSLDEFVSIIKEIEPAHIHLMKSDIIKNPYEYVQSCIGMIKYAIKHKNGLITIKNIADNLGIDDYCAECLILALEKTESIKINPDSKIDFIKPVTEENLKNDSAFEIFTDELSRIIRFKEYITKIDIETIRENITN